MRKLLLSVAAVALLVGCQSSNSKGPKASLSGSTMGGLEVEDQKFYELVPKNAKIEKLSEGFGWAEGPVWMGNFVIFSDVIGNTIYKWQNGQLSEYMKPSGYTGATPRGGEPGSNGLTLDPQGRLVLCE